MSLARFTTDVIARSAATSQSRSHEGVMLHIPLDFGYYYSVKECGDYSFICCVCGATGNCTVEEWRRRFHIFYIPTRTVARGYLFTWNECAHSLGMANPSAVGLYEERCAAAGTYVPPDCRTLTPLRIDRPIPLTLPRLVLISPLILFTCGLLSLCICSAIAWIMNGFRW